VQFFYKQLVHSITAQEKLHIYHITDKNLIIMCLIYILSPEKENMILRNLVKFVERW